MVLNQNEYTMASLGFNYQKPTLFLPNQTRPPSLSIKIRLPPSSHPTPSPSILLLLVLFSSPVTASGGGGNEAVRLTFSPSSSPKPISPCSFPCFSSSSLSASTASAFSGEEAASSPSHNNEKEVKFQPCLVFLDLCCFFRAGLILFVFSFPIPSISFFFR